MSDRISVTESDRLSLCFASAAGENRAALIGYLTAGDPDMETSKKLALTLAKYVDILEIGMPFSDPMADGPVIQAASERALASGMNIEGVFALASTLREANPELGIVFMGYANVAYVLGYENFALKAKQAGGDGVLIVDIPPEESAEFDAAMHATDLHSIRLLAPTSSIERHRLVTKSASGFLYYVSLTGVTGAKLTDINEIKEKVESIRQLSSLPIGVGFGIHSPDQARQIGQFADGVVVGSYFVGQIEKHLGDTCAMIAAMEHAASNIRQGLKRS